MKNLKWFNIVLFTGVVILVLGMLIWDWNVDTGMGVILLFFVLWLCVVALVYAFRNWVDKNPIPLVDLRKVEGEVVTYPDKTLKNLYYQETGRAFSSTLYLLMTPDERMYLDWLENKTTRYFMLKNQNES
jgi:hypothetical protein